MVAGTENRQNTRRSPPSPEPETEFTELLLGEMDELSSRANQSTLRAAFRVSGLSPGFIATVEDASSESLRL